MLIHVDTAETYLHGFLINYEASASELLVNLLYSIHVDVPSITQ